MNLDEKMLELRRGQGKALGEIYSETKGAVYVAVYSVLHHKQSAEDVMQDTYVHMVKNIDRYNPTGQAKAWICRMAKNLALNYLRDNRANADISDYADKIFAPDSHGEFGLFEIAEKVLDAEEFEAVMMYLVGGFSHKEVAEYQQIPYATVRWRYANALEKIKKNLEKEDISL